MILKDEEVDGEKEKDAEEEGSKEEEDKSEFLMGQVYNKDNNAQDSLHCPKSAQDIVYLYNRRGMVKEDKLHIRKHEIKSCNQGKIKSQHSMFVLMHGISYNGKKWDIALDPAYLSIVADSADSISDRDLYQTAGEAL